MEFNGPDGKGVCDLVFISIDLMSLSVSRQMLRNSIALYQHKKKKVDLFVEYFHGLGFPDYGNQDIILKL